MRLNQRARTAISIGRRSARSSWQSLARPSGSRAVARSCHRGSRGWCRARSPRSAIAPPPRLRGVHEEPEQPVAPEDERPGEPEEGFGRQWQPRLYVRLILIGLLIAYGIAFVLENNKHVHVHFVLGTAQ